MKLGKGRLYNRNCSVAGCSNKKGNKPSIHFHKYPPENSGRVNITNEFGVIEKVDRRKAWIMALKMCKPVGKAMLVCSVHFTLNDYLSTGLCKVAPKLKKIAVPSVNLPESYAIAARSENTRTPRKKQTGVCKIRPRLKLTAVPSVNLPQSEDKKRTERSTKKRKQRNQSTSTNTTLEDDAPTSIFNAAAAKVSASTSKDDASTSKFDASAAKVNTSTSKYDTSKIEFCHETTSESEVMSNNLNVDCNKRWAYVRDYYIRRKGKPVQSSGEAAKKRSDRLSFLDNYPSTQLRKCTDYSKDPEEIKIEEIENFEETCMKNEIVFVKTEVVAEEDANWERKSDGDSINTGQSKLIYSNDESGEKTSDSLFPNNCSSTKRRKIDDNTEVREIKIENFDEDTSFDITNSRSTKILKPSHDFFSDENDEIDLFFASIAQTVKKLPLIERVKLRLEIGALVGNAELKYLSSQPAYIRDPIPSTSTSSYSDYLEDPLL